jgi:radical SAM superfamily enzyme YgiQ (UPF0313 family)
MIEEVKPMNIAAGKRNRFRIVIPAYPAFNIYSSVAQITTALGPVCVASAVKGLEGWDVEVIDENNMRLYGPRTKAGADHAFLQEHRPADVVGLYGGLTSTIPRLYEIAKFYKSRGVVMVAGGQHFVESNAAECIKAGVDYVILGEAEEAIKELLAAAAAGHDAHGVKGIAYMKDGRVIFTGTRAPLTDFDKLPLPDFSLVRYADIKLYPVGRIRGCGMDCEFCTVKGKPRCASPERLLETIQVLVETRDARHFFIVDDLFGQQREETIRFCTMLRDYQRAMRLRLDLFVQIRLDKATDGELLLAMRQAGVNTIAIGFESPIRDELEAMKKHVRPEDMIALARSYHKAGFLVHGMFIFGYPLKEGSGFSMSAGQRIKIYKKFIRQAQIDTIQVLLPVPLPGTEFRDRLNKQNRIYPLDDIGWEYYDGNFPVFEPDPPMTADEMQSSARKIMGKFYEFKYAILIGLHIFAFPAIVFFLYNFKAGWQRWYREWRNNWTRFGGWVIIQRWTAMFKKGTFSRRLKSAQEHLNRKGP